MTISSEIRKVGPFAGNDTTTVFPFDFKVFRAEDLQVIWFDEATSVELTLTLDTDYTASVNSNQNANPGGNVTLNQPLPSGEMLTITSKLPFLQPADLTNQGGFYPAVITNALDRLTIFVQQLQERLGRALVAPISDGVPSTVLPAKADRARRYLSFDVDGRPVATTFDIDAVQNASVEAITAAGAAKVSETNAAASEFAAAGSASFADQQAQFVAQQVAATTPNVVRFSGDGEALEFELPSWPGSENNTQVFIGGVYQQKDAYEVDGTALRFTEAPAVGVENIEVVIGPSVQLALTSAAGVSIVGPDGVTRPLSDLAEAGGADMVGFQQVGAGAVARTLADKAHDVVSVKDFGAKGDGVADDSLAVASAVAFCHSNGIGLHWPKGSYLTTNNIPNLHDVAHFGGGKVLRSSEVFHVGIREDQQNTLYCAPGGLAGNDGLSPSEPMLLDESTLAPRNYGPHLRGRWVVRLAASVYPPLARASRIVGMSSSRFVRFLGPDVGGHPNVPTAIIDGGGTSLGLFSAKGMGFSLWVGDVKFQFTGGEATGVSDGAICQWDNVHQENCYYGLTAGAHSQIYLSGGIHKFTGSFQGYSLIRSIFNTKHNIGYKFDEGLGYGVGDPEYAGAHLIGNGSARGMHAQEGATGHVRSLLIEGFTNGVTLAGLSRMHLEYVEFRNNSVAANVEYASNIFDNNVIWNGRGVNKNSVLADYRGGIKTNTMMAPAVQLVGFADAQATNITSTTATDVASPYTLDGTDNRRGFMVKVVVQGNLAGTLGTKALSLAVGTGFVCSLVFPASVAGSFYAELGFIKTEGDYLLPFGFGTAGGSAAQLGAGESAAQYQQVNIVLDDGVSRDIRLRANVNSAGDSMQFGTVHCYRSG